MKRGVWHQFGDKSQTLAEELLTNHGAGVGAILSPRDLTFKLAVARASKCREHGAETVIDPQFHVPEFNNKTLATYDYAEHRASVQALKAISESDLSRLGHSLESLNRSLETSAVIAPAVIYEAGQSDLERLNRRLFSVGKAVGDAIGVPTYATVFFGRSITSAPSTLKQAVSEATSLDADGWYFAFEFPPDERLPSSPVDVTRCCDTGLTLAETGRPVLHAFAGPMSLISFGFGATGAGVAHSQIMWHFHRKRWEKPTVKGGSGDAPQRIFATGLWGTIVDQDETLVIPKEILEEAVVQTPFSSGMMINLPLDKRDASRHLVCIICKFVDSQISPFKAREAAIRAVGVLERAIALHARIRELFI